MKIRKVFGKAGKRIPSTTIPDDLKVHGNKVKELDALLSGPTRGQVIIMISVE